MATMTAHPLAVVRAVAPLAVLLAGACVAASGGPRTPIVTDRPDFTESAVAVPGGTTQLEAGATYADESGLDALTLGEVLVRRSIGAGRELRIGVPSYVTASAGPLEVDGFGDANVGVKLALHEPAEGAPPLVPTVGVIVGTSLPTGSRDLRADDPEPEAKLLLAWDVSERVALSSNVNWSRVSGADAHHELAASLSLGLGLTETVGGYLEAFAFAPGYDDAPRPAYLNGGLTWQLTPDFQLDARVGVGVADAPDSRFVGIGLSRRFW